MGMDTDRLHESASTSASASASASAFTSSTTPGSTMALGSGKGHGAHGGFDQVDRLLGHLGLGADGAGDAPTQAGGGVLLGAVERVEHLSTYSVYDACAEPHGQESRWCACPIALLRGRTPHEGERDRVSRQVHDGVGLDEVMGG